ncbi:MAG TPA: DUF4340 domain-containing protein [Verrucomicrobiae bacterium]|nr:DUF4340 domain-containing protein [Verrucomicrobiae bacterium]
MKFSVTVVFFLLFLLVAYFYVTLMPPESAKSPASQTAGKVLPLEEGDEIAFLGIHNKEKHEDVVLVREDKTWRMKEPADDLAEAATVESLVLALTLSSKARRLMPEKGWDEYGLKDPRLVVEVQTQKRPETRRLFFGDDAPVGSFVYARWEGEKDYFLIDRNMKRVFESSPLSFRERRIFTVPLKDIQRIRIQNPQHSYEVLQKDSQWFWTEPVALLGDSLTEEHRDRLLSEMANLFVKEFLGAAKSKKAREYGLMTPHGSITIWAAGTDPAAELVLGNELPEQDAIYSQKNGEENIFLVSRGKILAFFESLEAMTRAPAA